MEFKDEYSILEQKQQELYKERRELIVKTLKENGGKIVDERIKDSVCGGGGFGERINTTIYGKHFEPTEADIYSVEMSESEFGNTITIVGFDNDEYERRGWAYPENHPDILQFIKNYFEQ